MNEEKVLSAFEVYRKMHTKPLLQFKKKTYVRKNINYDMLTKQTHNICSIHTKRSQKRNSMNIKMYDKINFYKFKNIKKYNLKCKTNVHDNFIPKMNVSTDFYEISSEINDSNKECSKVIGFDNSHTTLNSLDNLPCNPVNESEKLFKWLIYPLEKYKFFENNWEILPVHITRNKSKYYKSLISTQMLDDILRNNNVLFTKNLDITTFTNDVRETHNPVGRALPSIVWDYFANGCSVRLLNPQSYIIKLYTLNSVLQEFFGTLVGANAYLTPPNSQGFAPHYDDIEAFILQIEGKKRWRLYKPRKDNEFLPRYSSPNISQKKLGKPILDTIVNAGDLLYFPRGTIHQADTLGFESHSLHITLSLYQKNSWGDFLEKLIPLALNTAIENDVRFRKGLSLNYLKYVGTTYSNNVNDIRRQNFLYQTKSLLSILFSDYINIDKAADEVAKYHIHDFLPPALNKDESLCSIYEGGERMIKDGVIINGIEIEQHTFVRLCRSHCVRLVEENGLYRLYYSCENSKEYHENELQFFELDLEYVPAIKELIIQYPQYIRVKDLPIKGLDKKIQVVRDLWEKAIVISKQTLPTGKNKF